MMLVSLKHYILDQIQHFLSVWALIYKQFLIATVAALVPECLGAPRRECWVFSVSGLSAEVVVHVR